MNDSDGRHIRSAARLLKAIANERRLSILCHLAHGEMCVGALVAAIGLSQSALSQHLARLRADGLVRTRRNGHSIVYALASTEAAAVIGVLQGLYCDGPPPDHSSALPSSPPETRT